MNVSFSSSSLFYILNAAACVIAGTHSLMQYLQRLFVPFSVLVTIAFMCVMDDEYIRKCFFACVPMVAGLPPLTKYTHTHMCACVCVCVCVRTKSSATPVVLTAESSAQSQHEYNKNYNGHSVERIPLHITRLGIELRTFWH